jgi:hypothetical protein
MRKESLEVLDYSPPNAPIIKIPGREFPGYLIPGDGLNKLYQIAYEVRCRTKEHLPGSEAAEEAKYLADMLRRMLAHYEQTLIKADHRLPYDPPLAARPDY